jgi:hypothetical protein
LALGACFGREAQEGRSKRTYQKGAEVKPAPPAAPGCG